MKPLLAVAFLAATLPLVSQTPTPKPAEQKPLPATISLRELSLSLEHLSTRVRGSVVQIFSTGYASPEEGETANTSLLSKQKSTGTGVILSADGYIVTNSHVIRGARRIEVRLPASPFDMKRRRSGVVMENRTVTAKVVGVDRESDLAVIKIDRSGLPHLALGNSDDLRQGELVMAFGNPLGLEGSVSMGIVSSTARQIKPDDFMVYIQTDAPINPGNSGGPLVDSDGRLMGINTFILSQSGGSEGLGFAIPSNLVRSVYAQIKKEGHVHRGQIGLHAQTITAPLAAGLGLEQDWGVLVADVTPEGPADLAGVKIGDIILSANGRQLENARQLELSVYRSTANQKVKFDLLRRKEHLAVEVPVVEAPFDPERFADMVSPEKNLIQRLGLLCIPIDQKLAAMLPALRFGYGLVVAAGNATDLTSGTGLQVGDVIYSVNGEPVSTVDAFRKKLDEVKPGDSPVFQIERSGRLMFVTIELE